MEKIVFEKLVSAWQMAKTLDDGLTNLGFTVTPVFDIEGHIADAIYYMLGEKTATFDESVTHSTLTNHEYTESQMADALLAEYRKTDRTSFPKSVLTSITEAANQMCIDIDGGLMGWTSIQDKYPDKAGDYLVSGGGKVWIAMFMKLKNTHGFCNGCKNPTIEAWMPLPEPYGSTGCKSVYP